MVQISPADQNPDMKDSHHFLDSDPNFIKNVKTKSKVAKLNKIGKNIPAYAFFKELSFWING